MRELSIIYSVHHFEHIPKQIVNAKISFYDLTILLKGRLNYSIDGQSYVLNAGDAMLAPAGCMLSRKAGEVKSNYISFNFTSNEPISIPVKTEACMDNTISLLVDTYDELKKQAHRNTTTKILNLLNLFILQIEDNLRDKSLHPLTFTIIKYIHNNLDKKITLADISRMTFFSPGYCEGVFKADMGKSITDYLINARIDAAKRMLAGSTRRLDKISENVGFDDYNYFARVFKKRTGYTPTEYRRAMLGKDTGKKR